MILGYEDTKDALLTKVKQSYKTDLESLVEFTSVDHANSISYHEGKAA